MSDEKDLDAPKPPGGPQRGDAPDGGTTPGTEATEPGPEVDRVSKRDDTHDIPDVSPQSGAPRDQDSAEGAAEAVQLDNAETSLDQPST
jgi:hypothetical protein